MACCGVAASHNDVIRRHVGIPNSSEVDTIGSTGIMQKIYLGVCVSGGSTSCYNTQISYSDVT
jgi:hypothetical protein